MNGQRRSADLGVRRDLRHYLRFGNLRNKHPPGSSLKGIRGGRKVGRGTSEKIDISRQIGRNRLGTIEKTSTEKRREGQEASSRIHARHKRVRTWLEKVTSISSDR